jgi:hypothetical protein
VRREHHFSRLLQNEAQGWQCAVNAMGLGDLALSDGHVKVNPQKHSFVAEVQIN